MKPLLCFVLLAAVLSLRGQEAEPLDFVAAERGPHHTVWTRILPGTNGTGGISYQTNAFVEMAAGLNVLDRSGAYVAASETIEPVSGGAAAFCEQNVLNRAWKTLKECGSDTGGDDECADVCGILIAVYDTTISQGACLTTCRLAYKKRCER